MKLLSHALVVILLLGIAEAFAPRGATTRMVQKRNSKLYEVPLELEGQLNPENKWTVKFIYNGEEKEVEHQRRKIVEHRRSSQPSSLDHSWVLPSTLP